MPSSSRTRSTRPSPSMAATPTPSRRSTPWSRCSSPHTMPSTGPSPRTSGAGSASSTVTLEAAHPTGRRHLGADEPGTDDHDPRPGVEPGPEVERVVDGAQHEDPVERRACPAACAGVAPVASSAPSNASVSPPSRVRTRGAGVERGRPHAEAQVDLELVVGRAAQRELLGLPLTGEQLLRERRTVVGQVRLGADEHDPAVVARPGAASRWPAAPPARPPPPPRFATPAPSPRVRPPSSRPGIPNLAGRGRASTLVQGGRTRVDATALSGSPARGRRLGRSFWRINHGSGLSTYEHSEYLLRSRICQMPGVGRPMVLGRSTGPSRLRGSAT